MCLKLSLEKFMKQSMEGKFVYLLARKLKGNDVKPEMDALSKEEMLEFKKFIADKRAGAEEEIWKKKRAERAEGK